MRKNILVYVMNHKLGLQVGSGELYESLHVGKAVSDLDLDMQGDDTGENISEKNKSFCELTGLYWIWKNTNHEYVGLSHYRRFFAKGRKNWLDTLEECFYWCLGKSHKRYGLLSVKTSKYRRNQILNLDTATKELSEYDAILPQKKKLLTNASEQYASCHLKEDFDTVREIIKDQCGEYLDSFDKMAEGKEIYAYNMFILKRELFDKYMEWLFAILFELEKRIDFSERDVYNKRVFGFMSERLLLVWIRNQKAKVKELPVLYFVDL